MASEIDKQADLKFGHFSNGFSKAIHFQEASIRKSADDVVLSYVDFSSANRDNIWNSTWSEQVDVFVLLRRFTCACPK